MKHHKPLSAKKPPKPDANHGLIEDWIANAKPALNPVINELDRLIRRQLAEPRYAIKWGKAYYGSPKHGWCIEVVAYDVSVNLVFLNGDQLTEPPELGEATRYVKIKELAELKSPLVQGWIEQSCRLPGWAW
jgi:hypothetical protein